ncbi:hypothetical protein ACOMHN_004140 [Nucella lapillus]
MCPYETSVTDYVYHSVPVPDLQNRNSLVFRVRTCSDAHIMLGDPDEPNTGVVEIVIDETNFGIYQTIRACLHRCEKVSQEYSTLVCDTFVPLWVSWTKHRKAPYYLKKVALGAGTVAGLNTLLSFNIKRKLKVRVNTLQVASFLNMEATWMFATSSRDTSDATSDVINKDDVNIRKSGGN